MVIYAKDIQSLLRCSQPTASRRLQAVKDILNKKDYQYVTISEFCQHYGLPVPQSSISKQLTLF
jgi:hypothetical protein